MKKRHTMSLSQRMTAGKAWAIRATLNKDPRAAALIQASQVMWSDTEPNEPIGITATYGGSTSLLTYTDDCFGSPEVEEVAGRYIYWAQRVPEANSRPWIHHLMVIRPVTPFRREADAEAFSLRVDAGRTAAIEQYESLDSNTSWLLDSSHVWYRPDVGYATAYLTHEMLNSSYHYRCERGGLPAPSTEEIADELAIWVRMALTAAVFAANKHLSELTPTDDRIG